MAQSLYPPRHVTLSYVDVGVKRLYVCGAYRSRTGPVRGFHGRIGLLRRRRNPLRTGEGPRWTVRRPSDRVSRSVSVHVADGFT